MASHLSSSMLLAHRSHVFLCCAGSGMSLSGTVGGNAGMSGSSGTSGGDGTRERELSDRRDRMRAAALRRAEAAAAQAAAPSAGGVNIKSA